MIETENLLDIQKLAARFDRDGFLVIDRCFDAAVMDDLDRVIRAHFGDDPDFQHTDEFLERSKTDVIPWFPQNDNVDAFDIIERNSILPNLTEAVLGPHWLNQYCMVMFSRCGTSGQAWHQDCAPDDPGVFNLNRLVYTHDISDDVGGQTVVVPGSHRRGLLPAGEPSDHLAEQEILRPKKGTLVLLHGHTWHRVLPVTGGHRFSVNYRAAPAETPADITDVCVYRNMRYRFSTSELIEKRVAD